MDQSEVYRHQLEQLREIGKHLRDDVSRLESKVSTLESTIAAQLQVLQDQTRMIAGLTSVAEDLRRELRHSVREAANFRAIDTFITTLKEAAKNADE